MRAWCRTWRSLPNQRTCRHPRRRCSPFIDIHVAIGCFDIKTTVVAFKLHHRIIPIIRGAKVEKVSVLGAIVLDLPVIDGKALVIRFIATFVLPLISTAGVWNTMKQNKGRIKSTPET